MEKAREPLSQTHTPRGWRTGTSPGRCGLPGAACRPGRRRSHGMHTHAHALAGHPDRGAAPSCTATWHHRDVTTFTAPALGVPPSRGQTTTLPSPDPLPRGGGRDGLCQATAEPGGAAFCWPQRRGGRPGCWRRVPCPPADGRGDLASRPPRAWTRPALQAPRPARCPVYFFSPLLFSFNNF